MKALSLFILLFIILNTAVAQEIGVDSTQKSMSLASDSTTTILDIMRDDTSTTNTDPLVYDIAVQDSSYIFNHGLSIALAWSFGSNEMTSLWKRSQIEFRKDVKEIFDTIIDSTSQLQMVTLEEPTSQAISFPFSLGYLHRFNNRIALHLTAHYSYQGKRSSFVLNEFLTAKDTAGRTVVTDTLQLYRYKTHLQHHLVEVAVNFEYLLIPDYFSVNNISRIGISAGASYIPLSLFLSNSTNESPVKEYSKNVYTRASAMGVGWRFAIFGEKEFSHTTAGRISLGYHGNLSSGFEGYQNLSQTLPDSSGTIPQSSATTTDAAHQFELIFTLFVGKKVGVEKHEE